MPAILPRRGAVTVGWCASSSPRRGAPATSTRSCRSSTPLGASGTRYSSQGPRPSGRSSNGTDYPFHECADPAEADIRPVWERVQTVSPDEANVLVVREIFARYDAAALLPGLRDAIEAFRPGLVVRETAEYGSAVAADLAGIPHARVGIGLAMFEELARAIAAETVSELRTSVGLDADPTGERLRSAPYLTFFPASLEAPERTRAATDPSLSPRHAARRQAPPRLVGRPRRAARLRDVRERRRRPSRRRLRLRGRAGGARRPAGARVADARRRRRRLARAGAVERPRRDVGAAARRARPRRGGRLPRRLRLDDRSARSGPAARRRPALRRPAGQRETGRGRGRRRLGRGDPRRDPRRAPSGARRALVPCRSGAPRDRDARARAPVDEAYAALAAAG